jgi:hypothetical protein
MGFVWPHYDLHFRLGSGDSAAVPMISATTWRRRTLGWFQFHLALKSAKLPIRSRAYVKLVAANGLGVGKGYTVTHLMSIWRSDAA